MQRQMMNGKGIAQQRNNFKTNLMCHQKNAKRTHRTLAWGCPY